MFLKPEGFDELQYRGGGVHRLRANSNKWKPLGIGEGPELNNPISRLLSRARFSEEDRMHYRRLGRSGLKVSEISLGAWITFGGQLGEEAAATSSTPHTTRG
jgi:hypothetical protein